MTGTLRAMRWWDIEAVTRLERVLFGADAWTTGLFWSELALRDERHYLAAGDGDAVTGYAGLAVLGTEGYVQTIAVAPDLWGQGLGSQLLAALLAEAERRGVTTVLLEVRADNDRATRLYERFGFARVGVRKGYYQPSGADALVMVRRGGAADE